MSNSSIKIPEDRNPFTVTVNGVTETFAPGTTAEVSPAVAAVIKGRETYPPEPAEPETPFPAGGGGGGGVLVVHVDENDTLDKTWQEIKDASLNGVVILVDQDTTGYLMSCAYVPFSTPPTWTVKFNRDGLSEPYATEDGADGYPVYSGT